MLVFVATEEFFSSLLVAWNGLLYRSFQFIRMEAERPGFAFIRHPACRVDKVQAIRPRGVRTFRRVAKFVEHRGNLDPQLTDAGSGNERTLIFTSRTGEYNVFLDVALHLPDIAGVRLCDVDNEKRNLVSVLLVELVEGGHLPPERRSGIASKDQHHRPLLGRESGQLHLRGFVELGQREVRSRIAHL